jgi:hypothetical protein
MKLFYRLLQGIVFTGTAALLWFFLVGIGDGSVGASNILLWTILLAVPVGALLLAWNLWSRRNTAAACIILAVPATPAFLYGLFVLMIVILQPDFR